MNTLPTISLLPLRDPFEGDEALAEVSRAIVAASRQVGAFYAKDHGLSPELERKMDRVTRNFFGLPEEVKLKYRAQLSTKAFRGFQRVGSMTHSDQPLPYEQEAFRFGREDEPDDPRHLHGPNVWPTEVAEMQAVVAEYVVGMLEVSRRLLIAYAVGLGLHRDYFVESFGPKPFYTHRLVHYPETDRNDGWGLGEHRDFCFLTMLRTDEKSGLEIKNMTTQKWHEVPPRPGTIIVNAGTGFEAVTRGYVKAVVHRVRLQRDGGRMSWPFFLSPGWDTIQEPVPLGQSSVIDQFLENNNEANAEDFGFFGQPLGKYLTKLVVTAAQKEQREKLKTKIK